jgi:hypothetical protein
MNSNTIGYMDIVVAVGHVFVFLETYHILLSSITAVLWNIKIFEYWRQETAGDSWDGRRRGFRMSPGPACGI